MQAYIAAMPGWKRSRGERLDRLIVRTVPDVRKAVKWNQPFYGHEGEGWFLAFRCYTRYVQLQFFRGPRLIPFRPRRPSTTRCVTSIYEDDDLDEDQLVSWIEQASNLPGEKMSALEVPVAGRQLPRTGTTHERAPQASMETPTRSRRPEC